jgi:hypothetical protein
VNQSKNVKAKSADIKVVQSFDNVCNISLSGIFALNFEKMAF